jgi:uncharacterized SAM-binding protein YcdF (DUF218 family)
MWTSERRQNVRNGLVVGALGGLMAHELELRALVSFWHDDLFLVPVLAVVGALLWGTRGRPAIAGGTVALTAVWLAVAFSPVCTWMARGLVRRDPPRSADAVFVLSSDMQRDGEPTSAAEARLLHGLTLVGRGDAGVLVLSEIPTAAGAYAAYARTLMDGLKLRGELLVVGPVRNTRDEALAVAALAEKRGWRTVLLVTSPTHSLRASAAFEKAGLMVVSSPCPETRYDLEDLRRPGDRLAAFGHLAHERVGLWLYGRRGWI